MKYSSSPRPERSRRSWLLLEKLPFLLLAIASSVVTFLVQRSGGAVLDVTQRPLGIRVSNAVVAYGEYLWKMLWPVNLSAVYSMTAKVAVGWVVGSGVMLLAVTALVVWRARRKSYLAVGWFWYVGTLVPVIGLVHVGGARMADRYTYIPLIGIFMLGVWAVAEFAERWRWGRAVAGTVAVAVLVACGVATARQVGVWKDSVTLFEHVLALGEVSAGAHNNLGLGLAGQGKTAEAIAHYQIALRLQPNYADAYYNLGLALAKQGQFDAAIRQYQKALRLQPDSVGAHNNLGLALAKQGQFDAAITHYQAALRFQPEDTDTHNNLGNALARQGQLDAAIAHYQTALRLRPDYAEAHCNLGLALAGQGKPAEAIAHYREALRLAPDNLLTLGNLAWLLATCPEAAVRNGSEAVKLAEQAGKRAGDKDANALDTLAATYAEAGRFAEAVKTAEKALVLAQTGTDTKLAAQIEARLQLYRQGKPYREK